jgi:integrase
MLTDKMVRAALPGDKLTDAGAYGDGRLLLIVSAAGRKAWVYRNRGNGRDIKKTLGRYPDMTLADAREAARTVAGHGVERRGTLGQLLDGYADSLAGRASYDDVRGSIKTNRHALYAKQAKDVGPADIAAILRTIAARGALVRVNRFRAMLSAAFNWGARRDHDPLSPVHETRFGIVANPVALVPKFGGEKPRDRILTDAEIKAYISGARLRSDAIGDLLLLQLMTGQRFVQLMGAVVEAGLLVVTDTKGRGGKVKTNRLPILPGWPLDRAMKAALLDVQTVRKASNALLPGDANALDLRRTIETRLMQMGVSRDDRGVLLSHGAGAGGVQAKHYERDDRLDMKERVLALWMTTLERIAK